MKAKIFMLILALVMMSCAQRVLVVGEVYRVEKCEEVYGALSGDGGMICDCVNVRDGNTVFSFYTSEAFEVGDVVTGSVVVSE